MAATKPDIPTGDRLRVTYLDGRPAETYDVSRSIYLADASEILGLTERDVANPIVLTFWLAWVAAGTPYLNGGADTDAARVAARKWLADDVHTIEELTAVPAGPPTKSRGGSRTSRA